MKQRNFIVAIILTIATCGLYGLYWMVQLNDNINELAGEPDATGGIMVLVLSLVTCGIYGIYWNYKMGERCDVINSRTSNTHFIFLILSLFGFGIVNYCIMQDTINKKLANVR